MQIQIKFYESTLNSQNFTKSKFYKKLNFMYMLHKYTFQ